MIYVGADHGGFEYKEKIKSYFDGEGIAYDDLGNVRLDPDDDYPDIAKRVAQKVTEHVDNKGILLCRSGVGMDIVANKHPGVRAVLGFNAEQVKRARGDEDVNILSIPSDYMEFDDAIRLIKAFMETPFSGEDRHVRRMKKIEISDKI